MSQTVISVENLSKAYRLGLEDETHDTLLAAATSWLQTPWRKFQRLRNLNTFNQGIKKNSAGANSATQPDTNVKRDTPDDILWALDEVTFTVKQGEVVGIIGRNGAGKSTLLKVLSRITQPTTGRIVIKGRVASLLEVGTGFHQELSGRENVYMNGTILGMTKKEIDRKFDEIVAFSGVEKFLDTPIKHYSSGMKVRLAFSVAAHLEPEILIIDEVLAVGDAAFQQKCLGKMQDVAHGGRTVLFVSHNAGALRSLCQRGILLEGGRRTQDGPLDVVLSKYLDDVFDSGHHVELGLRTDRKGEGEVQLKKIEILEVDRQSPGTLSVGQPAKFIFTLTSAARHPRCKVKIFDSRGHFVAYCDTRFHSEEDDAAPHYADVVICEFDEMLLMPGRYRMEVILSAEGKKQDHLENAAAFDIASGHVRGRRVRVDSDSPVVALPHRWRFSSSLAIESEALP